MLEDLNLDEIREQLSIIEDAGDPYGYECEAFEQSKYYYEYKDLFDDLSCMAYQLEEAIDESYIVKENWDDMTVALLGETSTILGYDSEEIQYEELVNAYDDSEAVRLAENRILKLTKKDMLFCFRRVLGTLMAFYDLKTAYDCLSSVVNELEEKGAILEQKNEEINRLYSDFTNKNLDKVIGSISPNCRLWVE